MNNILFTVVLCSVYVTGIFGALAAEELPIVKIPDGRIQGHYSTSYDGRKYIEFSGIPYAKPPIANLRFEDPVPKNPWKGTWIANHSAQCIQVNHYPEPEGGTTEGTEDCLYINVYIPGTKINPNKLRNVIVYIHGGALMFASPRFGGPKFLMDRNAIFVNFNYRLGVFGFLSTGDENLPGNMGMKDQTLAMKWVRNNIKYFGGNPNSVTLAGLSAGGASVHFHYFSPSSRNLFARGISISGCALNPWMIEEEPLRKTKVIGKFAGCTQDDSGDLVKCLKQRPAAVLVEGIRLLRRWLYNPFSPMGLVVDGASSNPFLPEHPFKMLTDGNIYDVPWISTMTTSEGLYPAADFLTKPNHLKDLNGNWSDYAPAILHYIDTIPDSLKSEVAAKMRKRYLGNEEINRDSFDKLVQLIGDRLFVADWELCTRLHSKAVKSPVYAYIYDYLSEKRESLVFALTGLTVKLGVSHGDDILQMLTYPFEDVPAKMTKNDERMKDTLVDLWVSFTNTGAPYITQWTPVSKDSGKPFDYLYIGRHQELMMKCANEMGNRSFWESIPFKENAKLYPNIKYEL